MESGGSKGDLLDDLSKQKVTFNSLGGLADENPEIEKSLTSQLKEIFEPKQTHPLLTPYYEDGNPNFYSMENMEKRKQLKTNDAVQKMINDFLQEF